MTASHPNPEQIGQARPGRTRPAVLEIIESARGLLVAATGFVVAVTGLIVALTQR
jgi:hypothetical protein